MNLTPGIIKSAPSDFVVDEIPAYLPSGEGPHLYLHFKKTNRTTDHVVNDIARALNVNHRDIGIAGVKDKVAVTTQWISLLANDATLDEKARALQVEGVEILEVKRHANKLKTGHLHGNRFELVIRGVDPARLDDVKAAFDVIAKNGVPNAFGHQRFGRDGDNVEKARAWLTGNGRAPGDPRLRRFHFSAVQSAGFNAVLDARARDGSWTMPILGDVLKKEETGGMFVCTDVQLDRERAAAGEVCPTGPMIGDKMRQPEADALALEQRILEPIIEGIDLHRARALGEGTRRVLRLRVTELRHTSSIDEAAKAGPSVGQAAITVQFVLPKGAYATTVLAHVFEVTDGGRVARESTGTPPTGGDASQTEEQ